MPVYARDFYLRQQAHLAHQKYSTSVSLHLASALTKIVIEQLIQVIGRWLGDGWEMVSVSTFIKISALSISGLVKNHEWVCAGVIQRSYAF
jgi:hypothetical protein